MYTEACLCRARMNHPHVRVNRLQAKHSGSLLSPDVVRLTTVGLKPERDRPCVLWVAVRGGQSFTAVDGGDVVWSQVAVDKLQRAEHVGCKLFVVGWQQPGWSTACLNAGGPWILGHSWLKGKWPGWSNVGHWLCVTKSIGMTLSMGEIINIVLAMQFTSKRVWGICLQQWHTLDPHAKHYPKVIKGS